MKNDNVNMGIGMFVTGLLTLIGLAGFVICVLALAGIWNPPAWTLAIIIPGIIIDVFFIASLG